MRRCDLFVVNHILPCTKECALICPNCQTENPANARFCILLRPAIAASVLSLRHNQSSQRSLLQSVRLATASRPCAYRPSRAATHRA